MIIAAFRSQPAKAAHTPTSRQMAENITPAENTSQPWKGKRQRDVWNDAGTHRRHTPRLSLWECQSGQVTQGAREESCTQGTGPRAAEMSLHSSRKQLTTHHTYFTSVTTPDTIIEHGPSPAVAPYMQTTCPSQKRRAPGIPRPLVQHTVEQ